jgi:hypothetical protein
MEPRQTGTVLYCEGTGEKLDQKFDWYKCKQIVLRRLTGSVSTCFIVVLWFYTATPPCLSYRSTMTGRGGDNNIPERR